MKAHHWLVLFYSSCAVFVAAQTAAPVSQPPAAGAAEAPAPAAPALRSAADLEKLAAPIALYPDPLIATMLPASVYPLEIVQAARFVKDTNNLAQLDAQPWDANVKAVARVPEAIQKMNNELSWTMELGEAFLAQDKDLMDAIQRLRGKAQTVGSLQTSPQQIVTVTNVVVEKTVEQQVVVVTNTVVQIQPSNPEVIYVPQYSPTVVYAPPPAYAPAAPLVTFGVGMLVGAAIANNNCDWYGGGCYHGNVNVNVNNNVNVNRNANVNQNFNGNRGANGAGQQKKWQPDQNRLGKSGSPNAAAAARTGEARGWGGSGASAANAGARSSSPSAGARATPASAQANARPSSTPSGNRASAAPSASPSASRSGPSPGASPSASRSSASPGASSRTSPAASSASAFSGAGGGGGDARSASSRGASSRSGGGGGRSSGGRGGGGRR